MKKGDVNSRGSRAEVGLPIIEFDLNFHCWYNLVSFWEKKQLGI